MSAYQIMLLAKIAFGLVFACVMFFIAGYIARFRHELKENLRKSEEKLKAVHGDVQNRRDSCDDRYNKRDFR